MYLYGYSKNEKSNLSLREEWALRIFAKEFLKLPPAQRAQKVQDGGLIPIEVDAS